MNLCLKSSIVKDTTPMEKDKSVFTPQPSGLEGYCRHGPGGRAGGRVGGRAAGRAAAKLAEPISL